MAEHLASTFGREKDRANCFFYFKVGACRHGDRCRHLHTRPSISPTLLLADMYQRQEHFEDFYEDWYERLSEYGEIECLNVCDNAVHHLKGNVYVQFREESHAADALRNLTGGLYKGCIRDNTCIREDYCNFLHLKNISRDLRMRLLDKYHRKHRSHEDRPHVGPSYGRHNDDKDRYHEEKGTRHRSRSPGSERGRSRSARGTRNRSPEKEGQGKEIRRTRE